MSQYKVQHANAVLVRTCVNCRGGTYLIMQQLWLQGTAIQLCKDTEKYCKGGSLYREVSECSIYLKKMQLPEVIAHWSQAPC